MSANTGSVTATIVEVFGKPPVKQGPAMAGPSSTVG